ncbi:glycosyl hydrolase family 18 protein [Saccharospirillum impatiens]|uniref:glycosyl hydrolase family 18 protein n=1 Tax=Saccharospirillum impatiens TaxID=169438 RepID=UPI000426C485|nr:glycosyl hydrolase family 18 protein [Saccharospirillum impatiens]
MTINPTLSAVLGGLLTAGSAAAYDCSGLPDWDAATAFSTGDDVQYNDVAYQANWWTQNQNPAEHSGDYQEWSRLGVCDNADPNQPPSLSLTDPIAGSYPAGTQLTLAASASDVDGTIASVRFMANGTTVDTLNQPPYSTVWTITSGEYTLTARATDDDGATSQASVMVTGIGGNAAPSVSLTSPTANDAPQLGDTVSIAAQAEDSDGEITSVEFFVGGASVGIDTLEPYGINWTAREGDYSIFARATDDDGATTDSTGVELSIGDGPVVSGCRPEGLYQTEGVEVPYCSVYDEAGREDLGDTHSRRIIGYFTSWRTGKNGQPAYLASDIPWEKLSHINYAFAHINDQNELSVGDTNNPDNPATGLTWPAVPGAEMDPNLAYQGHFNLLNQYKEQHPHVKTLISVGGWAETGGYFDSTGQRVDNGGFYTMTTHADGSVNHAGIDTFADSAVNFIRTYGFDGVDIDYEYPTSMSGAGNPLDFDYADNLRGDLWRSYQVLMSVLREKLDQAGAEDGQHYMLTIAAPSSGYLLRGMEDFDVTPYLDYVNIMTYDLHGAWNEYVGHNAALYDTGSDAELASANVYGTEQYGGIGYLNTDWAVKYFRGAMSAGRINIGVPYYTRGFRNVQGGINGLWGSAELPDQTECPTGTGVNSPCGYGATGIDNLWHDKDESGNEMGAGSNPMWHAKNLEAGIVGQYVNDYGFAPDMNLTGTYERHYDSLAEAPWLWNENTRVFLSTEDEQSMNAKVQYVIDQGVGGIMFWELAGDYGWYPERGDNGEYYMGTALTDIAYNAFAGAAGYDTEQSTNLAPPVEVIDVRVGISDFKVGDNNYPINPTLTLTNHTDVEIPGGTEVRFNMSTATSSDISDQSGANLAVLEDGSNAAGNNIGGLDNTFHRVGFTLPAWQSLAPGESIDITLNYYLPVAGPAGYRLHLGDNEYGLAQEHPNLPVVTPETGGGDGGGNGDGACDASGVNAYPGFPQLDANGNPSHAVQGDRLTHEGSLWEASWWTSAEPGTDASWSDVCAL